MSDVQVKPPAKEPPPLPDEAVVVRGGVMAEESLTASAEDHNDGYLRGEEQLPWALSVFSHVSDDVPGICRRAWPILNHNKIRVSTAGTLRELGYDVIPDGAKGHCLVPLEPPPWDWTPLRTVGFKPEEPNPEKLRRKKEAK